MAATGNAGEVPTFKLVLVGDGGTGALFLFFSFSSSSSSSSSSRLLCDDDDRFSLWGLIKDMNVLDAIERVVCVCYIVCVFSPKEDKRNATTTRPTQTRKLTTKTTTT